MIDVDWFAEVGSENPIIQKLMAKFFGTRT